MGIKEKRARYKEEFRREILDAARELFITEGYEKFSMRRLAEKIDYSPTTIYLYFRGRDDLLFAICEEFFGNFSAQLDRIRTVFPQDPVETLRHALLHLMNFGLENPNQYKLIFFTKSVYGTREELVKKEVKEEIKKEADKETVLNQKANKSVGQGKNEAKNNKANKDKKQ